MLFNVSSTLEYTVNTEGCFLLNIHALKTGSQRVIEESFRVEPDVSKQELVSPGGENRFMRLDVHRKTELQVSYNALVDTSYRKIPAHLLDDTPLSQFPASVLMYINPSRYCQSDRLLRFAQNNFGMINHGFEKVLAICKWINNNINYISGSTNAQTSAYDTITEQAGVCRDFAHLGIALCRASTIPARYFTGYAYQLKPADFHACFEAYLGGEWIVFDPTGLAPLNGLVKIATSKDAADASVATLFGDVNWKSVSVKCECLDENFVPLMYGEGTDYGISFG
ncbi:transglutaminase family protein [Pedobacter sp. SYSU D00535]|uniref:transglutaminase-like domain-containing protein n=1 Tax=Pedobacter sp. SYSU D00535 TaxID=2810308 RepID=UPI001A95D509|nr:transglutaminase family protein [Pedobacter sp. SYSU D00535]